MARCQLLRKAVPFLLSLILIGCASAINKNEKFSRDDSRAMIVLGIDSRVGGYELGFLPFDPETQKNTDPWNPNYQYDNTLTNPQGLQFTASIWKPGLYAIGHFCYGGGQGTCITFKQGTYYFELQPGKVNYIGNFRLDRFAAEHIADTDDDAAAYLKSFPIVDADLVTPELKRTGLKGLLE
jgi:hypothetical protein